MHSSLFHAGLNQRSMGALDSTAADIKSQPLIATIVHTVLVIPKIADAINDLFSLFLFFQTVNNFLDLTVAESLEKGVFPLSRNINGGYGIVQIFAGMVVIESLNGVGVVVFFRIIPNPLRPISNDDQFFVMFESESISFCEQSARQINLMQPFYTKRIIDD